MNHFGSFYYLTSLCHGLSDKVFVLPIQSSQLHVRKFTQSSRGADGLLAFSVLLVLVCNLLVQSLQTKHINYSHQNNPTPVKHFSKLCLD